MIIETVQLAFVVGLVGLLLLEQLLAARWSVSYFRSGVPLFQRGVTSAAPISLDKIEEDLNLALEQRFWQPLVFRRLPDNTVAFRERFWPSPFYLSYYLPIMHGRISPAACGLEVEGRSNWSAPLICAVIGMNAYREAGPELAALWAVFVGTMYALQVMRFRHVTQLTALAAIQDAA